MANNPFEELADQLAGIAQRLDSIDGKISKATTADPPAELKLITTDEFCKLMSISRVTAWNWERDGRVLPVRIGGRKRYRLADVKKLLNQ